VGGNPYQSPAIVDGEGGIDRAARARLAEAIRRFVDEQISAFDFDEVVQEYQSSPDTAVRLVAQAVWYHYDDCVDHMAGLSKLEWDYFQRLLLLLDSESQVEVERVRRWSWTQLPALGCLGALGWCVWRFGWGLHLLAYLVPCGLVSMAMSFLRGRRKPGPYDRVLTPFSSFAELSAAYRKTVGFVKKRYPRTLKVRKVHSRVAMLGVWLNGFALLTLLSPIITASRCCPCFRRSSCWCNRFRRGKPPLGCDRRKEGNQRHQVDRQRPRSAKKPQRPGRETGAQRGCSTRSIRNRSTRRTRNPCPGAFGVPRTSGRSGRWRSGRVRPR
jgi:hypothetical protein